MFRISKLCTVIHEHMCTCDYNEYSGLALELRQEVEGVTARVRFLSDAHQTVRDDIALTRRATEKTTTDVAKAEEDKLNQVT